MALNPFLDVVFEFIPMLVNGYAAKGVEERSNHWVVFERQVQFLIDHHGPIVAAFVGLGVARAAVADLPSGPACRLRIRRERRLGSILVLSLLLGYSVLHAAGMTLFRGQNYLPVVPFSSLVAAWAMVELWRLVSAPAPLAGLEAGGGAAAGPAWAWRSLAQQWVIVYVAGGAHHVRADERRAARRARSGRPAPRGLRAVDGRPSTPAASPAGRW